MEEYNEWIELHQGRNKLQKERENLIASEKKLEDEFLAAITKMEAEDKKEEQKAKAAEETPKKTDEETKALGQEPKPVVQDEKAEHAEKDREKKRAQEEKTRTEARRKLQKKKEWLEAELASVLEDIRIRKEVAVVRGSVEVNRELEGEGMYGDEVEDGVEKMILPPIAVTTGRSL
jgi:colicin import membrane protein